MGKREKEEGQIVTGIKNIMPHVAGEDVKAREGGFPVLSPEGQVVSSLP